MTRRRVLVTGADGFVGRHLTGYLSSRGWSVGALCLPGQTARADAVFHVNLRDPESLYNVPRGWDGVVHLAAASVPTEVNAARLLENVQMAASLLDHLEEGRVILVSSSLVYAASNEPLLETAALVPSGPYGLSKALVEALVPYYRRRLDIVIARPFNHIGTGMPSRLMLPSLVRRVKELGSGTTLVMQGLNSTRDFVDVRDVARAYEVLLSSDSLTSGCFNVCSGVGHSIEEVAIEVLRLAGRTCDIRFESRRGIADEVMHCVGSYGRLAHNTGWEPEYRLEDSLRAVWEATNLQ